MTRLHCAFNKAHQKNSHCCTHPRLDSRQKDVAETEPPLSAAPKKRWQAIWQRVNEVSSLLLEYSWGILKAHRECVADSESHRRKTLLALVFCRICSPKNTVVFKPEGETKTWNCSDLEADWQAPIHLISSLWSNLFLLFFVLIFLSVKTWLWLSRPSLFFYVKCLFFFFEQRNQQTQQSPQEASLHDQQYQPQDEYISES